MKNFSKKKRNSTKQNKNEKFSPKKKKKKENFGQNQNDVYLEFLQQLMNVEIPKSPNPKKSNFRENQAARQKLIDERREKRQKESKIRFAAQKAAREAEATRRDKEKEIDQKRRVKAEFRNFDQ